MSSWMKSKTPKAEFICVILSECTTGTEWGPVWGVWLVWLRHRPQAPAHRNHPGQFAAKTRRVELGWYKPLTPLCDVRHVWCAVSSDQLRLCDSLDRLLKPHSNKMSINFSHSSPTAWIRLKVCESATGMPLDSHISTHTSLQHFCQVQIQSLKSKVQMERPMWPLMI